MKKRVVIAVAVALTVGTAIGWTASNFLYKRAADTFKIVRENSTSYKFVNPVIFSQVPENTSIPEFQALKKDIAEYVTAAEGKRTAADVSVYFRQLNTDSWVGINVDDTYAPASMLKVVSLIAFLHSAQQDPTLYSTSVTIDDHDVNANANQDHYPPKKSVVFGRSYPASQLLSYMIIHSDNTATNAVNAVTGLSAFNKTLADFDIPAIDETTSADFISPKAYSRVFRALYNGSYLSSSVSEQALDLLSKTTFADGLVAGVPPGITVSHKFGERSMRISDSNALASTAVSELHDCGIIYAPNDPYVLCVMTFPAWHGSVSSSLM